MDEILERDPNRVPVMAGVNSEDNVSVLMVRIDPTTKRMLVVDANSAAIAASLAIIDDWDESDRAKVNLIVGQAGITAGAGAVAANTPRVTHASDDPAVTNLSTLAGIVTSNRAAVNPISGQAGVAAGSGTVSATTQRVVLATDVGLPAGTSLIGQVAEEKTASASLSNVSSSATNTTILNSNSSRKKVIIHNDSTSVLRIKYGATASSTSYTYKIGPDDTWEMPVPIYTGQIDGIWSSANGAARVTEL